jgi:hypothetical protein
LCRLVANHSYAIIEARRRGVGAELATEFPVIDGIVADALVYCDMTTDPHGQPVDVEKRLSEISARYGPGNLVSESIEEARPRILQSVRRVTGTDSRP